MVKNPNQEIVEKINKGLEKTGGYCPCRLNHIEDNICKCKEMREERQCVCRLYVNVVIYSAEYCPHCAKLKRKLDALDITYQIRDIEQNETWRDELVEKGFQTIPVLKIGELFLNPMKDDYMQYLKEE